MQQRRQEIKGLNQFAYKSNTTQQSSQSGQPATRGLLNRTTAGTSQNAKAQNMGQQAKHNRSFNAPMMMRHTSPNQQNPQFIVGGGQQNASSAANRLGSNNGSTRPQQAKAGSKGPPQRSQQQALAQQQRNNQNQYQPSLIFKAGQAKQQFEHLKQARSEPEIVSYSTHQPTMPQQPPMSTYGQNNPATIQGMNAPWLQQQQQQYQNANFQPQFASNQSHPIQQQQQNFMGGVEGGAQNGAQNQHPYPRQFPYESNQPMVQNQARRQQFASPEHHPQQRPDALKKSPDHHRNLPLQMRQVQLHQRVPQAGPTHQMKAYDAGVFYPAQNVAQDCVVGDESVPKQLDDRVNLLRKSGAKDPDSGEDDQQIREMESLLAEIGADVSELKKRPFYKQNLINLSEPRSSAKRSNKMYQTSKSNSLSPESHKQSRSRLSNSQEGQFPPPTNVQNELQHRSMSPQARSSSQGAGVRKQASSQSRKNIVRLSPQQLLQVRSQAQTGISEQKQWTSPNDNARLSAQVRQNADPTPSHTNTMSLTVSMNPNDHNQERLFRLSPLSSKMQEDTDGEEQQSNSQRHFNLNQSINNSQLDSSSPENHLARERQSAQLGASQSTTIMQELTRVGQTRTFEDDDDEVANAILGGPAGERDSVNQLSQQQKHSEQHPEFDHFNPVLRASALTNSSVVARTDTPQPSTSEAAYATTTTTIQQQKQLEPTSSRAFSRSSNRRDKIKSIDTVTNLLEGPKRTILKDTPCQTDPQLLPEKKVVVAPPKIPTSDHDTQTHRRDFAPVQLTPFDTYDLFFVKDLVNNLNQDNEVLVDSNQDLKYAFHFLMQKHKQLQQQLSREKAKNVLFEETEKRLALVIEERDKALEQGLHLGNKVTTMSRVMRLAVDEQAHLEEQAELMMGQLEEENQMLRNLLKISDEHAAPVTQKALTSTISEIEKKQSELAYQFDLKLREQIKNECQTEFQELNSAKIEGELKAKFDIQTKEMESNYEEQLARQEEETAILKKTLLEQSLQRLQNIQAQNGVDSEESNSLEGSHGLHHFSGSSAGVQKATSVNDSDQLQMSGSFSSKNNSSVVLQQELDEFTQNVYGDLTKEEQELVSQLTACAAQPKSSSEEETKTEPARVMTKDRMQVEELSQQQPKDAQVQQLDDVDVDDDMDEDDEMDDYTDDFEQFGEEARSLTDEFTGEHKLIQVVTNPKQPQPTVSKSRDCTEPDDDVSPKDSATLPAAATSTTAEWRFEAGLNNDLFSCRDMRSEADIEREAQDDADDEPEMGQMVAKMNEQHQQQEPEIDLFACDVDQDGDAPDSKEREELMKEKFDEFFSSESDDIEADLIDGESSDSDSESGNLGPNRFEELIQAQELTHKKKQRVGEGSKKDLLEEPVASPQPSAGNSAKQPQGSAEESSSSERRNKYKRDKRPSSENIASKASPEEEEEECKMAEAKNSPKNKTSSFIEQASNNDDVLEFNPPEPSSSNIITQDFDDDFDEDMKDMFTTAGGVSSAASPSSNLNSGFYGGNWDLGDDDDEDDMFASGNDKDDGDIDDEDRRFFEELSKGFSAKEDQCAQQQQLEPFEERTEMMDDTRATRQMIAAAKLENADFGDDNLGAIDFNAAREEEKEDEYDYFLDNAAEENGGKALGYHVIDEGDLQDDDDEDLEELTEEEKEERHREMLKEFKEHMEREDQRASRSPRHKPRF